MKRTRKGARGRREQISSLCYNSETKIPILMICTAHVKGKLRTKDNLLHLPYHVMCARTVWTRVEKNPGFYTKNPITLGFWQKPWVFVGFWVFGLDHRCWCRKAVVPRTLWLHIIKNEDPPDFSTDLSSLCFRFSLQT